MGIGHWALGIGHWALVNSFSPPTCPAIFAPLPLCPFALLPDCRVKY
ncbi:hypothetical protein [aff. Roholtiella sp. LEGE 12411]|nr:hypothetical protein [aff. Roholtiella sp. LEGE 12411]